MHPGACNVQEALPCYDTMHRRMQQCVDSEGADLSSFLHFLYAALTSRILRSSSKGNVQEAWSEELRTLAFLSGILVAFAMDALLQLNFSTADISRVVMCGYAITLAITVCCFRVYILGDSGFTYQAFRNSQLPNRVQSLSDGTCSSASI